MAQIGDADSALEGFAGAARAYAVDLIATVFLFACASLAAGRVWRFPFDDEIHTLSLIERQSAGALLTVFPASQDVHPQLSYLLFHGLRQLGLGDPGMRLCSLAMTAAALLLFQILVLRSIAQASGAAVPLQTRLIAVLLFGLSPLAVSQGDALRWYPLFALLIALFVNLYLEPRNDAVRLCSGPVLGLAASTNLLAVLMVPALLIYRHNLQRRFRWSFELVYWLSTGCTAILGFYTVYSILAHRGGIVQRQFEGGIRAVPIDVLGFFGGDSLGVGQSWIVVPTVIIFGFAALAATNRKQPGDPAHLLLLLLAATATMMVAGFAKPRSFLYLAPIVAALLTLFFDRQAAQGHAGRVLILAALVLATSVSAIANVNSGVHPFKRNSVIPYQSILDFIQSNETGSVLVISTDPVIPWILRATTEQRCAGYFFAAERCLNSGRRYDSIFVVFGHSDRSENRAVMEKFAQLVAKVTAGRDKAATLAAGVDEDAALKSHLTGVALDRNILTVDLYR